MFNTAKKIVEKLKDDNHNAVFAGGAVRDLILGLKPHDIDIATSATPDEVEAIFPKTLPIGKSFGVIQVIENGMSFEVATFRSDSYDSDGRRPNSITYSSMRDDSDRRDITINSMFFDPINEKIIDYNGGKQDLQDGIIRMVGSPENRIAEDFLRMLRVIRFAVKYNFKIDIETLSAIKNNSKSITLISSERIQSELIKMLETGNYRKLINLLLETEIMDHILPELKALKGCLQPYQFHPEGCVLEHTILALESLESNSKVELRLAVLLHDIGKPISRAIDSEGRIRFNGHDVDGAILAKDILTRLRFSSSQIDYITNLIANHMKWISVKSMRRSRLRRFMSLPYFEDHMKLHKADCLGSNKDLSNYEYVKEQLETLAISEEKIRPDKLISGADLIALGWKPGPIFKTIIEDVEDRQLEGVINTRSEAMLYLMALTIKIN